MTTGPKGCVLCPRACHADRDHGKTGYCQVDSTVRVARASLHAWEEPCLSGTRGSGTVFFPGCPLGCVYCQNRAIACGQEGVPVTEEELAEIFRKLQEMGANNINLVTPTHYVPQIIPALKMAKRRGLTLPILYNTGSYETVETLRLLDGLVDIYLPDLKYVDPALSTRYSHAPDYFTVASAAIAEMVRQVGEPVFFPEGSVPGEDGPILKRGVLVRHMMLPGGLADSKRVVRYLYDTYGDRIFLSLMSQYTPLPGVGARYPELQEKISWDDYFALEDYALDLGVTQAFVQEEEAASESFIPDFTGFDVRAFLTRPV